MKHFPLHTHTVNFFLLFRGGNWSSSRTKNVFFGKNFFFPFNIYWRYCWLSKTEERKSFSEVENNKTFNIVHHHEWWRWLFWSLLAQYGFVILILCSSRKFSNLSPQNLPKCILKINIYSPDTKNPQHNDHHLLFFGRNIIKLQQCCSTAVKRKTKSRQNSRLKQKKENHPKCKKDCRTCAHATLQTQL